MSIKNIGGNLKNVITEKDYWTGEGIYTKQNWWVKIKRKSLLQRYEIDHVKSFVKFRNEQDK